MAKAEPRASNSRRLLKVPAIIPPLPTIEIITHSPTPKTEWITVSPDLAINWLNESNTNNRPIRDSHVNRLASDMKEGKWKGQNGEAIRFDSNNRIVDGQHRLWACVQSGVSFETLLITGLDPEVYSTINTGRPKNFGDFLGPIHGEKNTSLLASIIKLVHWWAKGQLSSAPSLVASISQLEITYAEHPDIRESANWVSSHKHIRDLLVGSYAGLIHYSGCREGKRSSVESFLTSVGDGLGLLADDPAYQLRKFLLSQKAPKLGTRRAGRIYILALAIKAWNLYKSEKKCQILSIKPNEEFPRLGGL